MKNADNSTPLSGRLTIIKLHTIKHTNTITFVGEKITESIAVSNPKKKADEYPL